MNSTASLCSVHISSWTHPAQTCPLLRSRTRPGSPRYELQGLALFALTHSRAHATTLGPHPQFSLWLCCVLGSPRPLFYHSQSPSSFPASFFLTTAPVALSTPPPPKQLGSIPVADLEICAGLTVHSFKKHLIALDSSGKNSVLLLHCLFAALSSALCSHSEIPIDGESASSSRGTQLLLFAPALRNRFNCLDGFLSRLIVLTRSLCPVVPVIADPHLDLRLQTVFNHLIFTTRRPTQPARLGPRSHSSVLINLAERSLLLSTTSTCQLLGTDPVIRFWCRRAALKRWQPHLVPT